MSVSDADEAIRLINAKRFMSTTLQVSPAPALNRVVITDMQQNVDEDRIVLHLEQRKVTSVDNVEVSVDEFYQTKHAAIVSFTHASGSSTSHKFCRSSFVPWFFLKIIMRHPIRRITGLTCPSVCLPVRPSLSPNWKTERRTKTQMLSTFLGAGVIGVTIFS